MNTYILILLLQIKSTTIPFGGNLTFNGRSAHADCENALNRVISSYKRNNINVKGSCVLISNK